jgi:ATPase subunit of ABC transporter with duplicated ATPase domains
MSRISERHFFARLRFDSPTICTGGYDDMVLAKTQIRARVEAGNAQREKKIAQLNEFIARFSAGTRSAQTTSRKKEVERLQTSELAKSNIQRPYIRFQNERPSGRHPLEVKGLSKSDDGHAVIRNFTASIARDERIALLGRNGSGKTTMLSHCAAMRRDSWMRRTGTFLSTAAWSRGVMRWL